MTAHDMILWSYKKGGKDRHRRGMIPDLEMVVCPPAGRATWLILAKIYIAIW